MWPARHATRGSHFGSLGVAGRRAKVTPPGPGQGSLQGVVIGGQEVRSPTITVLIGRCVMCYVTVESPGPHPNSPLLFWGHWASIWIQHGSWTKRDVPKEPKEEL